MPTLNPENLQVNCVSVAKLLRQTVPLSSLFALHGLGLSLAVHKLCSTVRVLGQGPNLACPASHLCGALHRGASCHL